MGYLLGIRCFGEENNVAPLQLAQNSIETLIEEARELADKPLFANPAEADLYRRQIRGTIDATSACLAAVQLGLLGEHDQVELTWWKSKTPIVRTVSAAVLLLQKTDEIQLENLRNDLLAGANRFDRAEATSRKQEILFVYKNRELFEKLVQAKRAAVK